MAGTKLTYFPRVDGLRFIAIVMVLLAHFPPWIGRFFSSGYYGVDLFFVISGFLITGILCNTKETNFLKAYGIFLGRRTLRIFPVYYLTVGILYLLNADVVRHYIFYFLTYTYNYAWAKYNIPVGIVHHFWSLCVEEQFYLFWPLVVLATRRWPKILTGIIIIIILIGFSQRAFNIFSTLSIYNESGLLTRMASLGMGALGAVYSMNYSLPVKFFTSKTIEIILLAIVLPLCLVFSFKMNMILVSLVSLYLVLKAAHFGFRVPGANRFLEHKKVLYIGSISYGIYIYHVPLTHYFDVYIFDPVWASINFSFFPLLEWHPWIFKLPLYCVITISFAAVSFRFIEKKILKLKDRFFAYSKTAHAAHVQNLPIPSLILQDK